MRGHSTEGWWLGFDTESTVHDRVAEENSKMEELVEYTVRNVLTVLRLKTRYII